MIRPSTSAKALKRFLNSNGIGPVAAGRALHVKHPTVIMWCDGRRRPNDANRERIATWTNGEVPADGWGKEPERPMVSPFRASGAAE